MPSIFDNKYLFIRDLGQGGFGKVFLAKEQKSENLVAIKQLKNQDKKKQDALIHEMQIISKFNHSHIVIYKHHFIQDDFLYIVMEYCSLGSLREILNDKKTTSTFIWKWINTLTETLQLVHEKKIIHHDIKPDNILFTEDRIIKLSDFGMANKDGGTMAYMSPEALNWKESTIKDIRVDIYALGVTLLELLTGKNPFAFKSADEILVIHDKKDFGISHLPNWQQEIILKAIAKIPEQRFQSMKDFNEAVQSQYVPIVFDNEVIIAGGIAEKSDTLLNRKKWIKAYALLDYAEKQLKPSVNILRLKGKYFLMQHKVELASNYYEKALKWNPRLDVQRDLGWINLEKKNYPTAISLLSDHLHRNPSDYEAYNLLLQCFYETNRYELAMDLAKTLLDVEPANMCFKNNYYVNYVMHCLDLRTRPVTVLKNDKNDNPFLNYNFSVINEKELSHGYKKNPTLKSKLLFMDYRFNKFKPGTLYCTNSNIPAFFSSETEKPIIKIGRESFPDNDMRVPEGTNVSRRHCLIINSKDDVWLYDLASTGIYVNNEKVIHKTPLIGKNIIRIGQTEYEITNDKTTLL